jgi:hypothetical protein
VVADHAIRQHRERVRVVAAEDADAEHAQAAAAVDMVDEDEFASVGVRFLEVRKLPGHGAVRTRCLFLVLCSCCFVGGDGTNDK